MSLVQVHRAETANIHGVTGNLVGTTDTQTLTNKTLTAPTIASPTITAPTITDAVFAGTVVDSTFLIADNSDATKLMKFELGGFTTGNTRTITVPDSSDTMVNLASAQTMTNKTVKADTFTIVDPADTTKGLRFTVSGVTSGQTRAITVPDGNGTLATIAGTETFTNKTLTSPTITSPVVTGNAATGFVISKTITFTEQAGTTCTGTVVLPANSTLHDIMITSSVLWGGTSAVMKVGDSVDDDGFFIGVDLKATDLLVGEVLSLGDSENWGGKNGAYLVAATGQRGPAATNFGLYYAAGSNIIGVVTMNTPSTTGRTFMTVTYSVGQVTAATVA